MVCSSCGQANPGRARRCERCGARLSVACAACGARNPRGNRFCGACGARIAVTRPRDSTAARPGGEPVERVLTSRQALEGERKWVTVLFADIKGSMELLADRDPDQARGVLDPVVELMMAAVHRYGGTVNQVMGDGVMALFGAPLAHEDHAARACCAALDMQAGIRRGADELLRTQGVSVQARVGIHSGEVVVRSIGSDLRMDYSAVGQTVHLASRMEQLATPGRVLITHDTLRLAEGLVMARPLGPVPVKGLARAVEVFEAVRAGHPRPRLRAAAGRGLTPLVGRSREVEALAAAARGVVGGHGAMVAIRGEAGVGKSRLIWELARSPELASWLVLAGSAVSYGAGTPFLPVVDLFRSYFQVDDGDDPQAIRGKVTAKLLGHEGDGLALLPEFLALFELPVDDPRWNALDPPRRRRRTLDAAARLLARESRVQPILAVFEDMHWADTATRALVARLVDSLPASRLLLLVSERPDQAQGWPGARWCSELDLDPLPAANAERMLDALLGADSALRPLEAMLVERTQGNPLFLEEIVRDLAEAGVIVGHPGAYRLARPLEHVLVPPTVQAIIAARIDRLRPGDKRLLQAAAAIGERVPCAVLRAIADGGGDEVRDGLERLRETGFLRESSLFPDLEYAFRHALTHEVAYGSLVHDRRRSLHRRVLGAIEALHEGRLAEQVERLAHHAERGECWDKAFGYLREAGRKALARSAYREALAWLERALAALDRAPASPALAGESIDLRFDVRNALLALGEHERTVDHLSEAQARAEAAGDRRRVARALVYRTTYLWNSGDPRAAAICATRALGIAGELGDHPLEVVATIGLAWAHHALGDYEVAARLLRDAIASLPADQSAQAFGLAGLPSVVARTWLAWCLAARGEFDESLAAAHEGMRIARDADHPYSLVVACFGIGASHLGRGECELAIPLLERGLELCRSLDIRTWLTALASALGYARAVSGRDAPDTALLREAVDVSTAMRARFRQSQRVAWLGEALLLEGRLDEAGQCARDALALAREHCERGHEAQALHLLGAVALGAGATGAPAAIDAFGRALGLSAGLGMRPLVAHCHLGLARAHALAGRAGESRRHQSLAIELAGELGMRALRERAERAARPGA